LYHFFPTHPVKIKTGFSPSGPKGLFFFFQGLTAFASKGEKFSKPKKKSPSLNLKGGNFWGFLGRLFFIFEPFFFFLLKFRFRGMGGGVLDLEGGGAPHVFFCQNTGPPGLCFFKINRKSKIFGFIFSKFKKGDLGGNHWGFSTGKFQNFGRVFFCPHKGRGFFSGRFLFSLKPFNLGDQYFPSPWGAHIMAPFGKIWPFFPKFFTKKKPRFAPPKKPKISIGFPKGMGGPLLVNPRSKGGQRLPKKFGPGQKDWATCLKNFFPNPHLL